MPGRYKQAAALEGEKWLAFLMKETMGQKDEEGGCGKA